MDSGTGIQVILSATRRIGFYLRDHYKELPRSTVAVDGSRTSAWGKGEQRNPNNLWCIAARRGGAVAGAVFEGTSDWSETEIAIARSGVKAVIRMTSTTPRWALRRIPAALSSHVDGQARTFTPRTARHNVWFPEAFFLAISGRDAYIRRSGFYDVSGWLREIIGNAFGVDAEVAAPIARRRAQVGLHPEIRLLWHLDPT
jgi:hypothetical protein